MPIASALAIPGVLILRRLKCLVLVLVISVGAGQGISSDSRSVAETLLQQSRNLQMLALGERHWSAGEHTFIRELLLNSHFADVFPVIIVEFGNAFYQDVVDRYVSGQTVPVQQLEEVWRNTTMPMAWDSPVYADFFTAVRDANKSLPTAKKIRLLLGDPPIDWSKVDTVEKFKPYMDRDAFYADLMIRHCETRRCLLICGTNHFYWKDPLLKLRPPSQHENALEYYLEQKGIRNRVQSVLPIFSDDSILLAKGIPSLLSAHDPPLDRLRFGQVDRSRVSILKKVDGEMRAVEVQPDDTLALSEVVDWVLYLGAVDEKASPVPSIYQDRAYIKELYRRSKIVGDAFGFDMRSDVEQVDPDAAKND
jgi:hypothetical protein